MKKKQLTLLLALTMTAAIMTACGGNKDTDETSKSEVTSTESLSTESKEEKPSTDVNTPGKDDVNESTEGSTEESTTDEEMPTVSSNETIDAIFNAVRTKLGDNYFPNMPIEAIFLQDMYGIDLTNVEAAYGEMPMISANVDTFIAVKAVSGSVEAVKADLEEYLKSQQENAFQYPINIPVIQNTEVYVSGDYVFYICLAGDTMPVAEQGDEAIGNQAKQMVSDAKTVIDENLK